MWGFNQGLPRNKRLLDATNIKIDHHLLEGLFLYLKYHFISA